MGSILGTGRYARTTGIQIPQKRRTFFSFHYQNDVWRANQVRNSWRYKHESQREAEGFFDASLWESSKRTSADSLKALIRGGMKNTTVTCVLAGEQTFARRWVQYEMAHSIVRKNGLLVVDIHNLKDRDGRTTSQGPNPLDYMGVYNTNGAIRLANLVNGKWVAYGDYTRAVELPGGWMKPTSTSVTKLSQYAKRYGWAANNGTSNFGGWVRSAASDAGR